VKILLINPSFDGTGRIKGHGGSVIPLNLCYLAAYARSKDPQYDLRILDSEALGSGHREIVADANRFHPNVIGITTNTPVFDSVVKLTGRLKADLPQAKIVLGGPHGSALPERSLRESGADFVVVGEGEVTFAELLACIKAGRSDWAGIEGLVFKKPDGTVHACSPRALIADLDDLPFPARDLVDNQLYAPPPTKRVSFGPNTMIASSRGCPFRCGFCGAHTVWTRKIRMRSPQSVVSEIEECITRYGICSVNFTDEYFTADRQRVLEICGLIEEKKLKFAWVCSSRAERLNEETLRAMKKAGCREISFGIESGNPAVLKKMNKQLNLDHVRETIALTKKVGISTHASYIIGYIGETAHSIQDTIRLAEDLNTHVAAFFIASPLPGTELYREASEKNYLRPDATWQDFSPLSNRQSVLALPGLSAETIRRWHRKAIRHYYLRPAYISSRLRALRHGYEIANLLSGLKLWFSIKS
jgi:anaerobic magnesium-protoporphyrin IX monomethyl ester cyclase